MRTKTILLTAAIVAAGALSSVAQSNVYSLNVVGYINVPLAAGYNLIANQLNGTNNLVNTVLPGPYADNCLLYKWNAAIQNFSQADTFINGAGWVDNNLNPSTNTVNPGEGVFFFNAGAATSTTLVGQVQQGATTVTVHSGYSFLSSPAPILDDITTNGFPAVDNMTYQTFDTTANNYSQALTYITGAGFVNGSLATVPAAPAVGSGYLIFNPGATTQFTRTFTVQ
jgi:hypothetical protein